MRLSPEHIQSIKSTAHAVLGEGVRAIHQIAAQKGVVL